MLTGGSTSIRAFEPRMREAGAAARALLSKAAAERWNANWEHARHRERLRRQRRGPDQLRRARRGRGEARAFPTTCRSAAASRTGCPASRCRGSICRPRSTARRSSPATSGCPTWSSHRCGRGRSATAGWSASTGRRPTAFPACWRSSRIERWAAAVATNWWAANRAVEAMKPVFETHRTRWPTAPASTPRSRRRSGRGRRRRASSAAAISTGRFGSGRGASAPTIRPAPRAERADRDADRHRPSHRRPARNLGADPGARPWPVPPPREPPACRKPSRRSTRCWSAAATAASSRRRRSSRRRSLAARIKRPVQLVWSRIEETMQDSFRPPARAALSARLGRSGTIAGWQARIAAPATVARGHRPADCAAARKRARTPRLGGRRRDPALCDPRRRDRSSCRSPLPLRTGLWRSGAHSYTAFFTESFIDELARKAGTEPLSFRMQMLGENPRLARCLSTAAALGGWDGGAPGSAMGIAAHSAFGSHVATPGRSQGRQQPAHPGQPRGLRGRLRAGGQSRDRPPADRGRHHPRHRRRDRQPDPTSRAASPSVKNLRGLGLPRLADSPEDHGRAHRERRGAGRRHRTRRARPSRPPSPTPFSPRPASGCARCRW